MADSFIQPWIGVNGRRPAGAVQALRPHAASERIGGSSELDEYARQDARLAAEAAAGHAPAFDELVERYSTRIYAHLFRLVRNREEAEDLTQETFLRAYRSLARFDTARPFKSWVYKIATNAGLNAIRARKRRGVPVPLDAPDALPQAPGETRRRELSDELQTAIDELAPEPAALIHLHYHEGMSIREAGGVVGMTEGAAKVALHRARKRLRELLIEARRENV